ncbi:MAG: CBS domain-containing protein [Bacteroidales bacterium]|nr:CBS domain-containing protein [Bacteroidales bacterium]MBR2199217.1 CBS domain-containing protein [Bacteroidales bacterium]MBR4271642.1 CBS domain-containing protein [Bacteroidales bacterium]
MSASQLISEDIPTISPMETVSKALRIIDDYKYEHLPIVSEGMQYVGIVSESELRDAVNTNVLIESLQVERPSVADVNDIYGALGVMSQHHYSILPVADGNGKYLGCITRQSLIDHLAEMTAANAPGGVIELETESRNFSPAVISNVAEYNSMKVLSMLSQPLGTHGVRAVLKLNGHETTSVIQGLERNGYRVRQVRGGDSKYSDMLEEHYDALIRYMNL